jgi:hypothetical protein
MKMPQCEKSSMATVNHSFSKRTGKHLRYMLVGLGLAGLAGCAARPSLMSDDLRLMTFSEVKDTVVTKVSAAPQPSPEKIASAVAAVTITPVSSPVVSKDPAQCDYLREDALAQTDIMRSPSLRGSYNDSGKASLSLGMSLTDFGKANTVEEAADVRCRLYKAETGLRKIVFLSPQGLTASGFRAKSDLIQNQRTQLQKLKSDAMAAMGRGDIDHEKASGLIANIDKIFADASAAKSQADRRTNDLLGLNDNASILGQELLRAESDLHDLNSRMRTYDATDLSVSAGYNDDLNNQGLATNKNAFSAKINFSVKLGALLPQRFNHEERAKQARLRAVGEEGGMIWQVNTLRLAHERAIEGLVSSQSQLEAALAEARKLSKQLGSVPNPEFSGARIATKIQIVALESERAGVVGSIAEIRQNMQRLKTKG